MKHFVYVGSNTGPERKGLRVIEVDGETGAFRETGCVEDAEFPIYLALSRDGRHLYAAEKCDPAEPGADGRTGAVAVYRTHPGGAAPERLRRIPCAQTVPCHISLAPDGRTLFWAEYRNAWTGTFATDPSDGTLRGPLCAFHHEGHGPNAVRQEAAHCHFAMATPEGDEVFVCDLGSDLVAAYGLRQDGTLQREPDNDFRSEPGAGPRHLVFHPNGRWAYLVTELSSTVVPLRREGRRLVQAAPALPMLPAGFSGASKAAAIRLSPDGTQLAASNRGHDSLAFYTIDGETGIPAPLAIRPLAGSFPRDFVFLPEGRVLLVAHKLSNEFATYAYEPSDASIRLVQRSAPMNQPLCFLVAN